MSLYSKYLIIVACIGLVGIPIFILDLSDLSWQSNKEVYWGLIALVALVGTVLLENRARVLQKKIDDKEKSSNNNSTDTKT